MYPKKKHILLLLPFLIISFFQHLPFISQDIQGVHSWRQSVTMWNIRNFTRHDANILNPRQDCFNGGQDNIVRLEFPIMQWGIGMMQRVLGERIEVVRISIFLIGTCTILGIFFIVNFITRDWLTGLITVIFFQYAPVFYYYTINPLPDILALCASVWYLFFIMQYYQFKREKRYLIAASAFLCLATLSKLPYLILSMVSIYFFTKDIRRIGVNRGSIIPATFQCFGIIPAALWYIWVMPTWGDSEVLTGIFSAGLWTERNGLILDYHLSTMFPRLLLHPPVWLFASIGFILFIVKPKKFKLQWMYGYISMTFLFLLLEFNVIANIHDYYMFPFLPWLYILVGLGIYQSLKLWKYNYLLILPILVISLIQTPNKMAHYWGMHWHKSDRGLFLHHQSLKDAVPLHEQCIIVNSGKRPNCVFSYKIDKMGHIFYEDRLSPAWIEDLVINHHINYMYSDSEKINCNEEVLQYVEATIIEVEDIKVFKLGLPVVD